MEDKGTEPLWELADYMAFPELDPRLGEVAETSLVLLPVSRREDGKYVALQSTKTTLKLFRQDNIAATLPIGSEEVLYKDQRGLDWFGPAVFVSAALLSNSPGVVSIALNLISAYLYDLFGPTSSDAKVHMSIVVEETKTRKKTEIRYSGPVDGLKGLSSIVRSVHQGRNG